MVLSERLVADTYGFATNVCLFFKFAVNLIHFFGLKERLHNFPELKATSNQRSMTIMLVLFKIITLGKINTEKT